MNTQKAWVISVDMGYGHQRAAYPLKDIAYDRIITANSDKIVSLSDHRLWEQTREFYEFVSRLKHIPIIGRFIFGAYDRLQQIASLFPFRDLSKSNISVLRLKALIMRGLCKSIVEYASADKPVITTHFIPALAFNYHRRPVYCVVTDTDINRIWVADNPKQSTITYFSPCRHVSRRLLEYGVPAEKIIETGFPLPKENIGKDMRIVRKDILARLVNLDPNKQFFAKYEAMIRAHLDDKFDKNDVARYKDHPLTILFTIGGAGAQADIAEKIIDSLQDKIRNNEMKLIISVGTKIEMKLHFEKIKQRLRLSEMFEIVFALDKRSYFEQLNSALRRTDILWTKPSEMTFYTALGLPIIIAPPIGAHEISNKEWLMHIGSGFVQKEPEYAHEWIFYWLEDGRLADAALQGFIDAPIMGAYNIEKNIFPGRSHKTT